ncbi:MAG: hypothetical protein AAF221_00480 [Pseudomonadota bacterium]
MVNLATIRLDIQEVGFAAMGVYWLGKALRAIRLGQTQYYFFLAVDLEAVSLSSKSAHRQLPAFQELKPDDALFDGCDVNPDVIQSRYAAGGLCHALVMAEATPIAWIWHAQRRYIEDEVRAVFVLPHQAVWDYGVYVPPHLRAGRALLQLWSAFSKHMIENGHRYSISRISAQNRASLRAHKRLAHTCLGSAAFVKLGPLQFSFSTVRPYLHICASQKGAPEFDFGGLLL